MNEEEIKQAMKELTFIPKEELIKALLNKQQEVQQLRKEVDISNTNYDILYDYFSQMGELLEVDTCEEMINKIKQREEVINKAIDKLGRYADEMVANGNVYAICVDLLDALKKYKGDKK